MNIKATPEFREWLDSLSEYLRALVRDRLDRIRENEYFGTSKGLGQGLFELKWKSGLRVYFGYVIDADGRAVLMLLGGDKNGQNRDIRKARAILARETA
ncbi:MAG: type II toxin-antitoxin system RelE/ParE family toxin [Elusimicrobia bacterium]|nr:type II toxin-antitoxin system RelE/ParE family toxin [Elusimicrobiota bacterium]